MLNRIISCMLLQIVYIKAYIKLEVFFFVVGIIFYKQSNFWKIFTCIYNITVNIEKTNKQTYIYFVFALKQIHFKNVWNVWFQIH